MVTSTTPAWWNRLSAVPYRELLRVPGIGRAHDFQRVISYGLAFFVPLVIGLPRWRAAVSIAIGAALFIGAIYRLVSRTSVPAFPLAIVDHVLSAALVATLTSSPALTVAVVTVVALAIVASFEAPRSPMLVSTAAALLVGLPLAGTLGPGLSGVTDPQVAVVLIALLLTISLLILVFFTFRALDLRRTLDSREVQLGSVLAVTPVVIANVDTHGVITAIAGDVRGWLGLPGERIEPASDLAALVAAAADGDRMIRDLEIGDRVFSVTCDPAVGGAVMLTAYDITERVEASRRLEGLMRSKDQFIAAVSHELRTPLAAVLGFAEEIRDEMPHSDPLRPMVDVVADQSSEMAAIIDDLLVVARTSFDGVSLTPRRIDLAGEAASVAETIGPRLSKQPTRELPAVQAYADPIRVRQIIRNLLTNADRYGGDDVAICTYRDGAAAVLEVRDTGKALPVALRERIFEPYESSGPVGGRPAAIGLGLAVSRSLAEMMSGTLSYDHRRGCSVFELRLPAEEHAVAPA